MKKTIVMLTTLFLLIGAFGWALQASAKVTDAENRFCPVTGDKVSEKDFVKHAGKRYGLCCKMCANKFKKDPAKYMAQMAEQEANPNAAAGHEHHMH